MLITSRPKEPATTRDGKVLNLEVISTRNTERQRPPGKSIAYSRLHPKGKLFSNNSFLAETMRSFEGKDTAHDIF